MHGPQLKSDDPRLEARFAPNDAFEIRGARAAGVLFAAARRKPHSMFDAQP